MQVGSNWCSRDFFGSLEIDFDYSIMKEFPDHRLLKKCLLQIEDKLDWGRSASWPNEVFKKLSDAILETTDVMLSPTTLKRVWGKVNYQSAPSMNTLNTLARFAGYDHWLDFKNRHSSRRRATIYSKLVLNRGIIIGAAAVMALLFIIPLSMVNIEPGSKPPVISDQIRFSSYPVAKGLPNSVVFDLDLSGIRSDSLSIQQYWDKTKTIKLAREQKQATGIYYYPGYFRAKLLVDGQIIKEHDLFIKSGGWLGTIDYEPVPKYISEDKLLKGSLRLSDEMIEEIHSIEQPHYSSFHFVDDLSPVSADHFSLETTVKNVYRDKWAVCQTLKLVVLGTKGAMVIPFSIPGCVSDIGLMLNDVYLSGKEHDLSVFGADFSEFRTIKLSVKDQQVSIYLDGEELFTTTYSEPVGKLAGLRFRFLGAGEVQSLDVFDPEGQQIFQGNFEAP
jgi:hypothetical protein